MGVHVLFISSQAFEKCRKNGISHIPKKSIFEVNEGKLLGHIVSKYGVTIDQWCQN
jgi:hypothetical protein